MRNTIKGIAMAFVKLDTKILNSTIWIDADACKIFITALLMAEPFEVLEPTATVEVDSTEWDSFVVPPGWYGFVPAAGPGIVRQAMLGWDVGLPALQRLASPEAASRTAAHEGRRMVRVDGGYLILNFITYRDRDHTNAERQARFRARKKSVTLQKQSNTVNVTAVTHAYADAESKKEQKKKTAPTGELFEGVSEQVVQDFKTLRAKLRAPITATAMAGIRREAQKLGMSLTAALTMCCERGWRGFKADWVNQAAPANGAYKPLPGER